MKIFFIPLAFILLLFTFHTLKAQSIDNKNENPEFWQFRSIDTMKYSRDLSREKLKDPSFDKIIDWQVKQIAQTGASHIGIDTPYDEEFNPVLQRWVKAARKYNLKVWFRGNWSGWEGWFDYPKIGRDVHILKTQLFILDHPDLFRDGDIFTACPECENGGPGDPRQNGDVAGQRKFFIDEYKVTRDAFTKIGKNVKSNYNSMNGDVAKLVMDRETTKAMNNVVVIDHYVATGEQIKSDIEDLVKETGGHIVLGEFGAPIPDIQGNMTEDEQAQWVTNVFHNLLNVKDLDGMNYWTGVGGSTALWNTDGKQKKAVKVITDNYKPLIVKGTVTNELGDPVGGTVKSGFRNFTVNNKGEFSVPYIQENYEAELTADGYNSKTVTINGKNITMTLIKENEDLLFKLKKFMKEISNK